MSLLEKDDRMLWVMMDSYKKSDANHRAVFDQFEHAMFITDFQGRVEYANHKAKAYVRLRNSRNIEDVLPPACQPYLAKLLKMVCEGERGEEEVILKPLTLQFEPEQLHEYALKLEARPISWRQTNCMMLTAEDISTYKASQILVYSQHKKAMNKINILTREAESTYTEGMPMRRVDLERQLRARVDMQKMSFVQMSSIGTVELDQHKFSPHEEALRTIELLVGKALDRQVEVILTKEGSLPQVVRGDIDSTGVLLIGALEFCFLEADASDMVNIYLEATVSSKQVAMGSTHRVKYSFAFKASSMTTERMHQLFVKESTSIDQLSEALAKYGSAVSIFKSLLQSVAGTVDDAYVQEGPSRKVVLAYS
jgi:hypothetical protein